MSASAIFRIHMFPYDQTAVPAEVWYPCRQGMLGGTTTHTNFRYSNASYVSLSFRLSFAMTGYLSTGRVLILDALTTKRYMNDVRRLSYAASIYWLIKRTCGVRWVDVGRSLRHIRSHATGNSLRLNSTITCKISGNVANVSVSVCYLNLGMM